MSALDTYSTYKNGNNNAKNCSPMDNYSDTENASTMDDYSNTEKISSMKDYADTEYCSSMEFYSNTEDRLIIESSSNTEVSSNIQEQQKIDVCMLPSQPPPDTYTHFYEGFSSKNENGLVHATKPRSKAAQKIQPAHSLQSAQKSTSSQSMLVCAVIADQILTPVVHCTGLNGTCYTDHIPLETVPVIKIDEQITALFSHHTTSHHFYTKIERLLQFAEWDDLLEILEADSKLCTLLLSMLERDVAEYGDLTHPNFLLYQTNPLVSLYVSFVCGISNMPCSYRGLLWSVLYKENDGPAKSRCFRERGKRKDCTPLEFFLLTMNLYYYQESSSEQVLDNFLERAPRLIALTKSQSDEVYQILKLNAETFFPASIEWYIVMQLNEIQTSRQTPDLWSADYRKFEAIVFHENRTYSPVHWGAVVGYIVKYHWEIACCFMLHFYQESQSRGHDDSAVIFKHFTKRLFALDTTVIASLVSVTSPYVFYMLVQQVCNLPALFSTTRHTCFTYMLQHIQSFSVEHKLYCLEKMFTSIIITRDTNSVSLLYPHLHMIKISAYLMPLFVQPDQYCQTILLSLIKSNTDNRFGWDTAIISKIFLYSWACLYADVCSEIIATHFETIDVLLNSQQLDVLLLGKKVPQTLVTILMLQPLIANKIQKRFTYCPVNEQLPQPYQQSSPQHVWFTLKHEDNRLNNSTPSKKRKKNTMSFSN